MNVAKTEAGWLVWVNSGGRPQGCTPEMFSRELSTRMGYWEGEFPGEVLWSNGNSTTFRNALTGEVMIFTYVPGSPYDPDRAIIVVDYEEGTQAQ